MAISQQRLEAGNEVAGSLLGNMNDSFLGVAACADVVRAMVNQLGADELASIPLRPGEIRQQLPIEQAVARRKVIFDIAGRLGLEHVTRELYERPAPSLSFGRVVEEKEGRELHTVAVVGAILSNIDGGDVVSKYNGHDLFSFTGLTPNDIVNAAHDREIY